MDVEVFGVIRRQHLFGRLDITAATMGVEDLEAWPGERFGHQPLLSRAWELRASVRGWDAMYVALAELLGSVLLTTDLRLAAAAGLRCESNGDAGRILPRIRPGRTSSCVRS